MYTKEWLRNNYVARQKAWIKANNVKEGTKVLVRRSHESHSKGWNESWAKNMNKYIGKICTIYGTKTGSVGIQIGIWTFPYTVLDVIPCTITNHYKKYIILDYVDSLADVYIEFYGNFNEYSLQSKFTKKTKNGYKWYPDESRMVISSDYPKAYLYKNNKLIHIFEYK